jgi:hypothetical protein
MNIGSTLSFIRYFMIAIALCSATVPAFAQSLLGSEAAESQTERPTASNAEYFMVIDLGNYSADNVISDYKRLESEIEGWDSATTTLDDVAALLKKAHLLELEIAVIFQPHAPLLT